MCGQSCKMLQNLYFTHSCAVTVLFASLLNVDFYKHALRLSQITAYNVEVRNPRNTISPSFIQLICHF